MNRVIQHMLMLAFALALALPAAAQNILGNAYNGQDGPGVLADITWGSTERKGYICWREWDNNKGVYTGKTLCGEPDTRMCGTMQGECSPSTSSKFCVRTGATTLNLMNLTAEECSYYDPGKTYQVDLKAYFATQGSTTSGTFLLGPNDACTMPSECSAILDGMGKFVAFGLNVSSTPIGATVQRNGQACSNLVSCVELNSKRVLSYDPANKRVGNTAVMLLGAAQPAAPAQAAWRQLPGAAKAIASNGSGAVWVVNDSRNIYRWNAGRNDWDFVAGTADRLAVDPQGNAWVVNLAESSMWRWNGSGWNNVPGAKVRDVAISPVDGRVFAVNDQQQFLQWNGSGWVMQSGIGLRLAVDGNGLLWAANSVGDLYRREANASWTKIGLPSGTYAVEIAAGGDALFAILATQPGAGSGTMAMYRNGQWTQGVSAKVGTTVRAVAATAKATPLAIGTNASIWRYGL